MSGKASSVKTLDDIDLSGYKYSTSNYYQPTKEEIEKWTTLGFIIPY